jgi:hypothetical protein
MGPRESSWGSRRYQVLGPGSGTGSQLTGGKRQEYEIRQ